MTTMNKHFERSYKASQLMNKYWSLAADFDNDLREFHMEVYHHWQRIYQRSIHHVSEI